VTDDPLAGDGLQIFLRLNHSQSAGAGGGLALALRR